MHRARALDPRDVTRQEGLPETTPARTLLDLADVLGQRALRRVVRQAHADRRANLALLADLVGRANGRRGAKALAAILAAGPAPTRSELEDRVLDLLTRAGVERPQVNPVLDLDRRRIVPDFLWRDHGLVLEADGIAWHDGMVAREDDADRQAILEANGSYAARLRPWRGSAPR